MTRSTAQLRKLIERAETWPEAAQDQFLQVGLEIESSIAADYLASPEELDAIDSADRAPVVTAEEAERIFAKYRRV